MNEVSELNRGLEKTRREAEEAFSHNRASTSKLLEAAKEKSETFKAELWRGLLATNGAGLATSSTMLAIDGFPDIFIKTAAFLFFLGLLSAGYSWGLGLGFSFWASQVAHRSRAAAEAAAAWMKYPWEELPRVKFRAYLRRGAKLQRRITSATWKAVLLNNAHERVPSVGLISGILFVFGASALMLGVILFDVHPSENRGHEVVLERMAFK